VDHPVQIGFMRALLGGLAGTDYVFTLHEEYDESLVAKLDIPGDRLFRGKTVDDFIALYGDPRHVVLASRLHAGMIALANGVPAVFVGHDTRTYSFCDMMGLECIELFSETAARDALARLRSARDGDASAYASLPRRFAPLREAMREFLKANSLPVPP
jgi:hypothetical protein